MAARRIRGDVRQRKVTVFTRPPELNVILEDQGQGQCQGKPQCQGQGQDESLCQCDSQNGTQGTVQGTNQDSFSSIDNFEERGPLRRASARSELSDSVTSLTNGRRVSDNFSNWSLPTKGPDGMNDELVRLKQYTAKLNLPTRRPSYLVWRQQHFGPGDTPLVMSNGHEAGSDAAVWSRERRDKMDATLEAIRQDLRALRDEDQTLARRLMTLRREVHDVKVSHYYAANKDMLDEAMFNVEHDELDAVCDLPPRLFSPALKHYGLTPLNVQTRRFSVF